MTRTNREYYIYKCKTKSRCMHYQEGRNRKTLNVISYITQIIWPLELEVLNIYQSIIWLLELKGRLVIITVDSLFVTDNMSSPPLAPIYIITWWTLWYFPDTVAKNDHSWLGQLPMHYLIVVFSFLFLK